MTPEEYLAYVGGAKGLRKGELKSEIDSAIERTGLEPVRHRVIRHLSKGYRQRVGIAQALLASPEIIILDEPTVGLDPKQIIEIRELIRSLGQDHTVILSSHILTEISEVCDYAVIISGGRIVASDTIENLTSADEGKSVIDMDVRADREAVEGILSGREDISAYEVTDASDGAVHARIECAIGDDIRASLFTVFAAAGLPIISMNYEETTLEKVFLSLTEGAAQSAEAVDNVEDSADVESTEDETGCAEEEASKGDEDAEYEPRFTSEDGGDAK